MESFFDSIRGIGYTRGPERMFGGICGGIAAKTGIGVFWVRVVVVLSCLFPFFGFFAFVAYMIGWWLLPWQDGSIPLERLLNTPRR